MLQSLGLQLAGPTLQSFGSSINHETAAVAAHAPKPQAHSAD